jgi:hypothetical protein
MNWSGFQLPSCIVRPMGANVRDFGAAGDGITDDTAAIQAAINSWPAPGGPVFLPPGTYKVTSTLVFRKSTRLVGSSMSGPDGIAAPADVCVVDGSSITNAPIISAAMGNSANITVEYLAIKGPPGNGCGTSSVGLYLGGYCVKAAVRHVYIRGCYTGLLADLCSRLILEGVNCDMPANCAVDISRSDDVLVLGCLFANAGGFGVNPANVRIGGLDVTLINNVIDEAFSAVSPGASLLILAADRVRVYGGHIFASPGGYGVRLGDGTNNPTGVRLQDLVIGAFDVNEPASIYLMELRGSGHVLDHIITAPWSTSGDINDVSTGTEYRNVNGSFKLPGKAAFGGSLASSPTTTEIATHLAAAGLATLV